MIPRFVAILTFTCALVCAEEPHQIPSGHLASVKGDGVFDADQKSLRLGEWPGYPIGHPCFKEWSLRRSGGRLLLEATVISSNTGMKSEGTKIYFSSFGRDPELLAISDADGRVKMHIYFWWKVRIGDDGVTILNKSAKSPQLFVGGDPNSKGSVTRVYQANDGIPEPAGQDEVVQPATAADSKPEGDKKPNPASKGRSQ